MDVEAEQVADAVREEDRRRPALAEAVEVTLEDAEIAQARDEGAARGLVDGAVARALLHEGDRRLLRGEDRLVDRALRGREFAAHRPDAGDVRGPALDALAADVGEHEVARGDGVVVARVVEHLAVDRDDGPVGVVEVMAAQLADHRRGDLPLEAGVAGGAHAHHVRLRRGLGRGAGCATAASSWRRRMAMTASASA